MSDTKLIDETALERLQRLGGDAFVRQMLELFITYAPKRVGAARAAEQSNNLTALANAVHPLKSSAGQVGAVRVSDLAAEIESLAEAGDAAAVARLSELELEVEKVKSLLAARLTEAAT